MAGLADAHCHLQHSAFARDLDAVLERAVATGIERILVPGWDLASSEEALALAARHPGVIDAAVGIHPHHAAEIDEPGWIRFEALARDPAAAAIGEIGLDFFRNLSPPDSQRDAFRRQLALAERLGKPVVVHDRNAHHEIRETLLAWQGRVSAPDGRLRGMLHAFSGDAAMANTLATVGFAISFALPLTFRSASGPRAAAAVLPAGVVLVETDSPYLGPDTRGRNEPTTALRVAAALASLRNTPPQRLAAEVGQAYRRLIGG